VQAGSASPSDVHEEVEGSFPDEGVGDAKHQLLWEVQGFGRKLEGHGGGAGDDPGWGTVRHRRRLCAGEGPRGGILSHPK
jgi:hypothetical protein